MGFRLRAFCASWRPNFIALVALSAGGLAGCATSDVLDSTLVDPARYEGYNCKELVGQLEILDKRQKELQNLIDRADESTAGVVIGVLTYRTEYESTIAAKKVLRRTMVEKKCQTSPNFASDQGIR